MIFDTSTLATIIDNVRRAHGMTAYRPKMSDYQKRADAVLEIGAIAEDEQKDPCEVARVSYTRFIESKNAWLHNAGYPLGAWVQAIGHYWRPPKPLEEKPEPSRSAVYQRDTERSEARERSTAERYEREGSAAPGWIGDVVKQLKNKSLKNL